jgi:putative phosphoesterase
LTPERGKKLDTSFILVISDSHGDVISLTAILEWTRNTGFCVLDVAVFLGDGFEDLATASLRSGFTLPWHTVRGNCDYDFTIPDNMALEIPGKGRTLFLSHGHCYRVREDVKTIAAAARNAGAEAALFGHTHIPYCATVEGIFLLNPGSISRPRSNSGCTFAVLECPNSGPLAARFFSLTIKGRENVIEEYYG